MYPIFKCFVGNSKKPSASKMLYDSLEGLRHINTISQRFRDENVFYRCERFDEMSQRFLQINHQNTPNEYIPQDQIQQLTLKMVNEIIHACLEKAFGDRNMVEEFGREVFEKVGKNICGEDFVDETENTPQEIENAKQLHNFDGDFVKFIQEKMYALNIPGHFTTFSTSTSPNGITTTTTTNSYDEDRLFWE